MLTGSLEGQSDNVREHVREHAFFKITPQHYCP